MVRPLASLAGVMPLGSLAQAGANRAEVIRARTRCRFISFPWTRRPFPIGRPSPTPNLTENFQSSCIIGRKSTANQREVFGSTPGVNRVICGETPKIQVYGCTKTSRAEPGIPLPPAILPTNGCFGSHLALARHDKSDG